MPSTRVAVLRAHDACDMVCSELERLLPDGVVIGDRSWSAFYVEHRIPVEWLFPWVPVEELLQLVKHWFLQVASGVTLPWTSEVLQAFDTRDPADIARLRDILHVARGTGDDPRSIAAGSAFACVFALEAQLTNESLAPAAVDAFLYRSKFILSQGGTKADQREDRKTLYAEILAIFERTGLPEGW